MNGLPDRSYAVYLGLDVGKGEHHACALAPDGKRRHDKPLPQDEARLRALYEDLARHGDVLVVLDQPASIGALPVAVAQACEVDVAYLPGLAMRRIADLHPGNAKTDARDAYVIAEAARTMPHTLRRVDMNDDALADLEVIVGFDDDLAGEVTRVTNRIHGPAHPDPPSPGTRHRRQAPPQSRPGTTLPIRRTRRAPRRRQAAAAGRGTPPRTPVLRETRRGDHDRAG